MVVSNDIVPLLLVLYMLFFSSKFHVCSKTPGSLTGGLRQLPQRHVAQIPAKKQTREMLCRAPTFTTILAYASVNASAIPLCTDCQTYASTYSIMFELLMLPHSSVVCRNRLKTLVNYVHHTREHVAPMEPPNATLTSLGVY